MLYQEAAEMCARKRRAEEAPEGGGGEWSMEGRRSAVLEEDEEGDFPGPSLGSGPVWRLRAGSGVSEAGRDGEDGALLEQALSCSAYADVRFVFDDGESHVYGHRHVLSRASGEFRVMFESGMVEAMTGEVRVRGVGRGSLRGFLECLYLGRAGQEMGAADGREVWMLADMYDVQGVKEWLMGEGLDAGGVCAAAQYALEGEGFLSGLLDACGGLVLKEGLGVIGEGLLRGVSAAAAGVVLEGYVTGSVRVLQDSVMLEGFEFVERWARANGVAGSGGEEVESLLQHINLGEMCSWELTDIVLPSGLVDDRRVQAFCEQRRSEAGLRGRQLAVVKAIGFGEYGSIAVGSIHGEQRVAVTVRLGIQRVEVFSVRSGELLCTVGSEEGPGKLSVPLGIAFNGAGELVVCDSGPSGCTEHRVCVYDVSGRFLREMGREGEECERLCHPWGVAVSGGGDIVVADTHNHRVVVYRQDGTLARSLQPVSTMSMGGSQVRLPFEPLGVAVGPDGRVVVADSGSSHLEIFGPEGKHVLTMGARKKGQRRYGVCVAVSGHGEILLSVMEEGPKDMQLFSRDGALLESWEKADVKPSAVCVDEDGRVFFVCEARQQVLMLA